MRHRSSWLACWLWLAILPCAVAGPGYLPTVGPPPLRFADPAAQTASHFFLPPLEPVAVIAPAADADQTAPPAKKAIPPLLGPEPPQPAVPVENPAATVPPMHATVPTTLESPLFSPQMLLPYFTRGSTNASGASVLIPVNFQPPLPTGQPPSSSATYEVVPASKP